MKKLLFLFCLFFSFLIIPKALVLDQLDLDFYDPVLSQAYETEVNNLINFYDTNGYDITYPYYYILYANTSPNINLYAFDQPVDLGFTYVTYDQTTYYYNVLGINETSFNGLLVINGGGWFSTFSSNSSTFVTSTTHNNQTPYAAQSILTNNSLIKPITSNYDLDYLFTYETSYISEQNAYVYDHYLDINTNIIYDVSTGFTFQPLLTELHLIDKKGIVFYPKENIVVDSDLEFSLKNNVDLITFERDLEDNVFINTLQIDTNEDFIDHTFFYPSLDPSVLPSYWFLTDQLESSIYIKYDSSLLDYYLIDFVDPVVNIKDQDFVVPNVNTSIVNPDFNDPSTNFANLTNNLNLEDFGDSFTIFFILIGNFFSSMPLVIQSFIVLSFILTLIAVVMAFLRGA